MQNKIHNHRSSSRMTTTESSESEWKLLIRMMNIPQEIVDEILYRLPVKSLLRFKCICKRWLSMISHPNFNSYYKRKSSSVFAMTLDGKSPSFYSINDDNDSSSIQAYIKEHNNEPCHPRTMSNACNGLVLLLISKDCLVLCNPSTRYFVKALTLDCLDSKRAYYYHISIGLCYDASIDDYKALVMQPANFPLVFVCCLKSKKWVKIHVPFVIQDDSVRGPLVNGRIHWIINESWSTRRIIYFEPTPLEHRKYPVLGLGVLDGCLCIAQINKEGDVKLVAMKKYGVAESWTSLFVLPNLDAKRHIIVPITPLLHLTKNGEELLLMMNGKDIWAYNLTSKSYSKFDIPNWICAVPLVQTIVSLAI